MVLLADENDTSVQSFITEYITKETAPRPELLPIKKDTKLIETGVLDSLSMLKLVTFLEEKFGVRVAPEEVIAENFETVDAILRFLNTKKKP